MKIKANKYINAISKTFDSDILKRIVIFLSYIYLTFYSIIIFLQLVGIFTHLSTFINDNGLIYMILYILIYLLAIALNVVAFLKKENIVSILCAILFINILM